MRAQEDDSGRRRSLPRDTPWSSNGQPLPVWCWCDSVPEQRRVLSSPPSRTRPGSPTWSSGSSLFDRQRRIVLSARMLHCSGRLQRKGDVICVVAVQPETRRINAAMSATDSSRSRYHMVVATASRVQMDLILRAGCQCSRQAEGLGRMRRDKGIQVSTRSLRQTHVEPPCLAVATRNA